MDHDELDKLRQTHAAWRLLTADHAPLILSFCDAAFIRPNRRAVPAAELVAQLDAYLLQVAETHGPDRYVKSARQYLDDWAATERGFLRKYYPRSGDGAEFDLTPAAEKALAWVQGLRPHWGDVDTHGFAILNRLRRHWPHTRALLMDRSTLLGHRELWSEEAEESRCLRDLDDLNLEEEALYDDLRCDRLGVRVRLEQERIGYAAVLAAIEGVSSKLGQHFSC